MTVKNYCPKCGTEISDDDIEFCTECGYDLSGKTDDVEDTPKGFFDNLIEKTSFPVMAFAFVILGLFLFIGSLFWMSFAANGTIDFATYLILTVVFSVFFAGIFVGYFGCMEKSYIIPNFSVFIASVYAVVLTLVGMIFTFAMGLISSLSSILGTGTTASSEPIAPTSSSSGLYGSSVSTSTFSPDLSGIFKIILFILLIPIAAYFGVYLGYFLKECLN